VQAAAFVIVYPLARHLALQSRGDLAQKSCESMTWMSQRRPDYSVTLKVIVNAMKSWESDVRAGAARA